MTSHIYGCDMGPLKFGKLMQETTDERPSAKKWTIKVKSPFSSNKGAVRLSYYKKERGVQIFSQYLV